jgi:hypothetical protein
MVGLIGHLAKMAYFLAQWNVLLQRTENENFRMKVISLEALAHAPPLLLWPDDEMELMNMCSAEGEALKIAALDLARTLSANDLMMVGDGEQFKIVNRV